MFYLLIFSDFLEVHTNTVNINIISILFIDIFFEPFSALQFYLHWKKISIVKKNLIESQINVVMNSCIFYRLKFSTTTPENPKRK